MAKHPIALALALTLTLLAVSVLADPKKTADLTWQFDGPRPDCANEVDSNSACGIVVKNDSVGSVRRNGRSCGPAVTYQPYCPGNRQRETSGEVDKRQSVLVSSNRIQRLQKQKGFTSHSFQVSRAGDPAAIGAQIRFSFWENLANGMQLGGWYMLRTDGSWGLQVSTFTQGCPSTAGCSVDGPTFIVARGDVTTGAANCNATYSSSAKVASITCSVGNWSSSAQLNADLNAYANPFVSSNFGEVFDTDITSANQAPSASAILTSNVWDGVADSTTWSATVWTTTAAIGGNILSGSPPSLMK